MSAAPSVTLAAADVAASARWYPHEFDASGDRVKLIRLSEADYNVSSFLDQRVLTPGMTPIWVPFAELAAAAANVRPHPLHFIFHTGHVGSTLVSRLLDEVPGVLGLREPLPLRSLADMAEDGTSRKIFAERLDVLVKLWSRGFDKTQTVIVKPTSFAGRAAKSFLAGAPGARAIYLNLAARSYITAVLAASNGPSDLAEFSPLRMARLEKLIGETPQAPASVGEMAAIAWLVERAAQQSLKKNAHVLALDFEALLADLESGLGRIAAHFGLPASADAIAALARSPVLTRYSKSPDQLAFSPALRVQMMERASVQFRVEIDLGLALLERLAGKYKMVDKLVN